MRVEAAAEVQYQVASTVDLARRLLGMPFVMDTNGINANCLAYCGNAATTSGRMLLAVGHAVFG